MAGGIYTVSMVDWPLPRRGLKPSRVLHVNSMPEEQPPWSWPLFAAIVGVGTAAVAIMATVTLL
ncbi:MAG: hypothetical protein OXC14_07260 [Rhodospirillaceae bacterium]|nr:hypothetical protein [Rhodospirillaceae bacterium]